MSFNIQKFITELNNNGYQLNSRYDVVIALPLILVDKINVRDGFADINYLEQARLLTIRCDTAGLPGIALVTGQNNRFGVGVVEQIPFSSRFTEIPLVFIEDKNSNITNFWYSWFNLISNFADSNQLLGGPYKQYAMNYKDHFSTTIYINKYDEYGNKILTVVLNRAYPTSIDKQPLSWEDNKLSKSIVSISFQDWYFEGSRISVPE